MTRRRITLVVNPAAGGGRARRAGDEVTARLRRGADVETVIATSAAQATRAIAAARVRGDAVAVLGGDGLVHTAVQELACPPGATTADVPLGVLPAGTGNDAADLLQMSRDPARAADQLVAALAADSLGRLDLGRTDAGRWWLTVLCAGFDSAVNERANALRRPAGRLVRRSYDLAIAAEFLRLRARPFVVELDGVRLDVPALLVAVGNGPQYGGGKRITHGARPDDGTFLVTVVGPVRRLDFARLAPTMSRAGHLGHPAVTTHAARRVSLSAPGTTAYADGERVGTLPVVTECVPGALPVLVPAR